MIATVTVFASSSENLAKVYYEDARHLGELLAQNGFSITYGGGNNGLMGALAKEAFIKNGKLTGVITGPLREQGYCFEQAVEIIETATLDERKQIMEEKADAFIVLPGGIGTLDELFSVLSKKQLGYHSKPVILVNTNGFFDKLMDLWSQLTKDKFTSQIDSQLFIVTDDVQSVCKLLCNV